MPVVKQYPFFAAGLTIFLFPPVLFSHAGKRTKSILRGIYLMKKEIIAAVLLAVLAVNIISLLILISKDRTTRRKKSGAVTRLLAILSFIGGSAGVLAGLMLLPGMGVYSGAGAELITRALAGEADSYAFLLKLLFTALAIAGGFKGGEIVPTLCIGACFGACFGALAGLPVSLSGALGMIAVFAGATNCPIAALMIAMEMFEGKDLPFFAITVAISFVLSGYYSLYGKQRFAFAKTRY